MQSFLQMKSLCSLLFITFKPANNSNKDLERISKGVTQWEMNFNLDTTKQAQEVLFSPKSKEGSSSITV